MGINTELRNVTGVPQANYFDLVHYDVSNRGASAADAVLMVWWRAYLKQPRQPTADDPATSTLRTAQECGPATYAGTALQTLCADADARTQAYKRQGLPAGVAYALGQRDAIYAALQADQWL